jgi:hypothetical protein
MNNCEMPFDNGNVTDFNPLHNKVGIIPNKKVANYLERVSYNRYLFEDVNGIKKTCFKKYITLVDYVKYLIGKYKPEDMEKLPSIQNNNETKFETYINSQHNYAYVDGYFYFLTSKLLENGFVHGLDYYDNYICISKNCELNIADDFDYLSDSNFFIENNNKLFKFKDEQFRDMYKQNVPVNISNEEVELVVDDLDNDLDDNLVKNILVNNFLNIDTEELESEDQEDEVDEEDQEDEESEADEEDQEDEDLEDEEDENTLIKNVETEELEDENTLIKNVENDEIIEETYNNDNDSCPGSDHSTVDLSDGEELLNDIERLSNDTEEWETDEDDEDDENEFLNNELTLVVNKIPTQVIAIECCDTTFDSILEKNEIRIEELESAMFQVIVMLYMYQKVFKFTHNDLHTNNIMCISTKEEFLYYKILGKHYKLPTYGRIYKIIDFGRSIYTVNNVLLCSDSFSENGTANTQYNFEPFYNSNKPVIEPNYSFDLCRLACSMVDFIVDDMRDIDTYRNSVPVYDLIISWLYDDNGVNVLYKRNGEERYPDFKLYKMIARIVHNHTPEKQFDHACFKKYETSINDIKCMDLDKMINEIKIY